MKLNKRLTNYLFLSITIVVFWSNTIEAQNLVPNPSFESYTSCPTLLGQLSLAAPWVAPTTGGTSDYLNRCSTALGTDVPSNFRGYQNARTGDGYAHILSYPVSSVANYREYIQAQLTTPLIAGQMYEVKFYVSLSDKSRYGINNLGAYLSTTAPSSSGYPPLPYTPQILETNIITDTANWVPISGIYTATGGEQYITIGNFFDDASTSVAMSNPSSPNIYADVGYYIEDVSVTPYMPPTSLCDTNCSPNLAPNANFEATTVNCSDTISELFTNYSQVQGWFGIACDTCPSNGTTPDYYNSGCGGPANTNSCDGSNGSIGFFTYLLAGSNSREYVQAQLLSPLVAGQEYCVSVQVRTDNSSPVYKPSDGFGIWFTNQMVDIDVQNGGQYYLGPGSMVNATPQIENPSGNFIGYSCQTVSGTFIANGTEQWVVIGNFKDDSNTNFSTSCSFFSPCAGYLIIDNISIRAACSTTPQPPTISLSLTNDTICSNSCTDISATITGGTPPFNITWNNSLPNSVGPHNVCPNATTTYTAIVIDSLGNSDTASITLYVNPIDSINQNITICQGDSIVIGGSVYNSSGTYVDTLFNQQGCDSIVTTNLTVNPLPNAGTFASVTICPTASTINLFNQLGGTPDSTGSWSGPSSLSNGYQGTFDPSTNIAGTYIYSVTNSCGSDTASVSVLITATPDPGLSDTVLICSNSSPVNLFDSLGGTPSNSGTWTGPSSLSNGYQGTFDPSLNTAGTYTYTIIDCNGTAQTADIVVFINPAPNAGTSSSLSICNTDPPINLFNQLGGSPDSTGTWIPTLNSGSGIFNPSLDSSGTYLYVVSNSCGVDSASVMVTVTTCSAPIANYSVSDSAICAGECVTYLDSSIGATSWEWIFYGGNPSNVSGVGPHTICYDTNGVYNVQLIVSNTFGSDTANSTINVYALPTVDAGQDVVIELGDSTVLSAIGSNGTYNWSPSNDLTCANCTTPTASPNQTITYTVIVVDSNGCKASDEVTVIVDFEYVIWVPNIFSPNGDGNNDVVFVRGAGIESFEFFVYDRWGEKVFETDDLNIGWDGTYRGKKMNNGVFFYYLEATFLNGEKVTKKGDITLVR